MRKRLLAINVIVLYLFLFAVSVSASTFDLIYEFDGDLPVQNYGTVGVTQNGNVLDFAITANNSTLGSGADINEFYFNLDFSPTNLAIIADNAPNNPYTLIGPNPSVAGGAGASFEWGINFGNGGGPPGNSILQLATFTLSAVEPLLVSNLIEFSNPNSTPPVNLAVHFQGTTPSSPGSETVGAAVPIPAAAWLLGSGLVGLLAVRKRLLR